MLRCRRHPTRIAGEWRKHILSRDKLASISKRSAPTRRSRLNVVAPDSIWHGPASELDGPRAWKLDALAADVDFTIDGT